MTAPDAGEEESDLFQQLQLTYGCANPLESGNRNLALSVFGCLWLEIKIQKNNNE